MPQIPFVTSRGTLPGATGQPFMPSEDLVGQATQRAGAQIETTSLRALGEAASQKHWAESRQYQEDERARAKAEQYAEKLATAQRHVEAATYGNAVNETLDKKLEELRSRTDHENFDDFSATAIDEIRAGVIDGISDPQVRAAVDASFQGSAHQFSSAVRVAKAKVLVDKGKAALLGNYNRAVSEWVQEGPNGRQAVETRIRGEILLSAEDNIISQTEAVKMVEGFSNDTEAAYVANLINTDPERAVKELTNKGALTHLDPVKRESLLHTAKIRVDQEAVKEDEARATSELLKLKTEMPDIDARIAKIESPDYLKTLGPKGAKIQNTLLSYSLREKQIQEENYKASAADKVGKVSTAIYGGQMVDPDDLKDLRPAELALVEKIRDYQVRQDRADTREKRIEAGQERAELAARRADERATRQETRIKEQDQSDEIAGNIIVKITSGEPIDVLNDIYGQIPKGLKFGTANQLVGMVGQTQKDPTFKLGVEVIKKIIDPAERGRAMLDFTDQVKQEKATGKRIIEIADGIATPKKEGAVSKWLNELFKPGGGNLWQGIGTMETFNPNRRIGGATPSATPEKTVTIDGKQYKDGDIVTKDGKQFRVKVQ